MPTYSETASGSIVISGQAIIAPCFISESVRQYLLADPDITNLIGSRLYHSFRPQTDPLPALVYQTEGENLNTLDGPSTWDWSVFTFSCIASTYSQAKYLAEALRRRLIGFSGQLIGNYVHVILMDREKDGIIGPTDGKARPLFAVECTYTVFYRRA